MWFPIGPLWPGRQQGLNTHRFLSPRADELQHRLHPCFGDLRWVEQLPCKELPGTVLSMSPWTAKLLFAVLISSGRAGNSSLCIPAHFLFSRETALWSSISNSSIRKSQALDIRGTSPSRRIGEQTMIACPPMEQAQATVAGNYREGCAHQPVARDRHVSGARLPHGAHH